MPTDEPTDHEMRDARFVALADVPMVSVGSKSGAGGSWNAIREILGQREMLNLLVRRDLKARYKDSALGFLWSLVRPLTQLLIYYVVIGQFLGASRGIDDFAIYIFTGLTAYTFFSDIVSSSTASIVGNAGLIKKIYLPREIFPLASVGSALFNFMIQLGILLVATLLLGKFPISPELVYFIPAFLVILIYGTALGLLLSALNVYLRDIQYLVEVVLMILMWASPIVYSWATVQTHLGNGPLLTIYTDNPLTLAVLGFQKALWLGGPHVAVYPDWLMPRLLIAIVIGIVLLFSFQRVFAKLQGNFAQEL
ncbi:ABC transporter permease [Leifsonia poae]|uniref:ABC transporter permease n=1 Tax=Leifsonia poae TaxID=110933 RepID=UPI001CBAF52C|nr:ABC transporter permease [Leifsonia poae]